MHVAAPRPSNPEVPIFFNVDSSVGYQGTNSSQEDILLVQFFLRQIPERAQATRPGGDLIRQRMLKVPMSGVCDAATIDGIRAWQEGRKASGVPGTIVDGKVSEARGYVYGPGEWTIVDLNSIFRQLFPDIWPRLGDHPACPAQLKTRVRQVL